MNNELNLTMLTDFYELTMANGYFAYGMADTIGCFDMFFRKVPDDGGYAIMVGVQQLCEYLDNIKFYCLVMSENYIRSHFEDIKNHANVIENRLCDDCNSEDILADNANVLENAKKHNANYILIDDKYEIDI